MNHTSAANPYTRPSMTMRIIGIITTYSIAWVTIAIQVLRNNLAGRAKQRTLPTIPPNII